ncbi:MAG: helix-hairpin-helix domain-containing protein, partial [Candidatus Omnitrophica bacterium]|nr:helix-hairpin-helix domain-containing protein [Candidatus Omnitrophota bacterium]
MGLAGLAFQEIIFIKSYQRLSLSLPVAKAALKTVFYLREDDITPSFDTYDELTKEREQVLCSSNSFKYYFVDKVNSAGALEIIDESSLINLNTATVEVLKKLPGLDEDLADRIV